MKTQNVFPTNEEVKGEKENNNLYIMRIGGNNIFRQAHKDNSNWAIKNAHGVFVFIRKQPQGKSDFALIFGL